MNTSDSPTVSVVMPFYNSERTIGSAIRSVLEQSFTDFELILVDDGSTDSSLAIAERFRDARIKIINLEQNRGTAAAQNRAFALVRGEYVALHDSDDLWTPEKLAIHIAALRSCMEIDVSYGFSQMISADGRHLRNVQKPPLSNVSLTQVLCHHPVGNGSNAVFRRKILDDVRKSCSYYVDEAIKASHDVEMWVRFCYLTKCRFQGIPQINNYYRISESSYSANLQDKELDYDNMLNRIAIYAPDFIAENGSHARAFHSRYLARRAFSQTQARLGLHFMRKAIVYSPALLSTRELPRSMATIFGNLVIFVIPVRWRKKAVSWLTRISHT